MASVISSEVLFDRVQADGTRVIRLKYVVEDSFSNQQTEYLGPRHVAADFDEAVWLVQGENIVLDGLASSEVNAQVAVAENNRQNPDKTAAWQTQADFDRRVLGRMMLVADPHGFYASYPFFQAVESRGGSNAGQRAAYLGVIRQEYDQVAARYGSVSGVAWFLDDEKNQIWDEYPSDDWN